MEVMMVKRNATEEIERRLEEADRVFRTPEVLIEEYELEMLLREYEADVRRQESKVATALAHLRFR